MPGGRGKVAPRRDSKGVTPLAAGGTLTTTKTANDVSRPPPEKRPKGRVLPVLVFGFGSLLGLENKQGDKHRSEPEQHHKTGEIKFHGEPPQECIS